jgi:arylsulfatase
MLFDGRWKHNVYHGTGLGELFDLESDPGEFDNLWDDPAQRERRFALLREHLDAMMATSGAGPERVAMY